VAFILGAWLLVVGVTLVRAAGDLQAGRHAADRAHGLKLSDLATERPLTDLTRAARRLGDAHRELDSAVVAPLRLVPVAGRQLRSASALSGAASLVAETGAVAVSQGARCSRSPMAPGPPGYGCWVAWGAWSSGPSSGWRRSISAPTMA